MPSHSALARLQQFTTLSLLAASIGWAFWIWPASPLLALGGAFAIALNHTFWLALEFLLMAGVGVRDPAHRPTASQLLRAWLTECWYAAVVFGWRQPFAWRRVPDHLPADAAGARGIVFVHGFVCNRGFWAPWMRRARARGIPCVAVNLEPVFGPIDAYAPAIEAAVQRVTTATGREPVLVCHSMGGLAARAWLRQPDAARRVAHVVTIGSPHGGTWLAHLSPMRDARQMRLDSEWIRALAQDTASLPPDLFTCWWANCDNVVFPAGVAMLPGADNRMVPGAAHVDLAFHPEVMDQTLDQVVAMRDH